MVTLRLTRKEVQLLKLWGYEYKQFLESVGVPWDDDLEKLKQKLNKTIVFKKPDNIP